ncbi:hypothetical protein B0I35DRAFT_18011 [Stachybotrys elegans]|uniref:Uncharacterized protein n=1 Tax=Stachybotrys elegans TaxID=80388 RepID=A0A8K0SYG9_9HYPO|nr:hypothetical protein B0I35DRAFT_18011 [Stachybotrys elegans]
MDGLNAAQLTILGTAMGKAFANAVIANTATKDTPTVKPAHQVSNKPAAAFVPAQRADPQTYPNQHQCRTLSWNVIKDLRVQEGCQRCGSTKHEDVRCPLRGKRVKKLSIRQERGMALLGTLETFVEALGPSCIIKSGTTNDHKQIGDGEDEERESKQVAPHDNTPVEKPVTPMNLGLSASIDEALLDLASRLCKLSLPSDIEQARDDEKKDQPEKADSPGGVPGEQPIPSPASTSDTSAEEGLIDVAVEDESAKPEPSSAPKKAQTSENPWF